MRLWRRRAREEDLQRELRAHLELETEEREQAGLNAEEAAWAARRALGNTALVTEDTRAAWGWMWLDRLSQDLRYGVRMLLRSPAFTLTAVLSLALGIGANTAIFSILDAVLLRNLPVSAPEELVLLAERSGARQSFSLTTDQYRHFKTSEALTGLCAFRPSPGFRVTLQGESQLAAGQLVSGNYFSVLGVRAILGRTITEDDDRIPGAHRVAVLGYDYWQRQFSADPGIVGREIEIQGQPFTVIGVTPRGFFGLEPGRAVDVNVPLMMQPLLLPGTPLLNSPDARWLRLAGRRKPGVPLEQAQASLSLLWSQFPAARGDKQQPGRRLEVVPGGQGLYDLRRRFSLPLRVLMGVAAVVLLIACANLASLLLGRAAARRHEIKIRASLGASRARLLRQMLTETTLLSLTGGCLGLWIARAGSEGLVGFMSHGRAPIALDLTIHARTLAFTFAVSVITGLLFGIGPALRATAAGLPAAGARVTRGPRHAMQALIAAQIALALIVLVSAGLLLRSLRKLDQVDGGFQKDHVLLMSIRPEISGYKGERIAGLYRDLHSRFSALAGVRSATLSMDTPLAGVSWTDGAVVPGGRAEDAVEVGVNSVGPGFFETYRIPLLAGRELDSRDDARGPQVAVISESVGRRLFPGGNPLGRRIQVSGALVEIVGVVRDTRYHSLREAAQPTVYRPYLQMPRTWEELFFGIATRGDPEALAGVVRRELRAAARDVPVYSLKTLEAQVDGTLVEERMVSALSTLFGGLALVLAAIGLYGRLAFSVAERTKEIGVRLALGAERGGIVRMVFRQVLSLALCGIGIGIPLALVSARAVRSLLYGLDAADPLTLIAVVLLILAVSASAAYIPARRASKVDPMVALRYE